VIRAELNLVGISMRTERKVVDKIVDGLTFHSWRVDRQIRRGLRSNWSRPGGWPTIVLVEKGRCPSKSLPVHDNGAFAVFAIFFDDRNRLRRLEFIFFDQRRVSFSIGMNGPA
jgi:hypothetical protein